MKTSESPTLSSRPLWRTATLLAFAALACGLLLGGLSAWFLGSVAIAGLTTAALTFNFHIPAAFIRLFAVGRTAAKYGERLVGHKAALTDQVARRVRLFVAMAAAPGVRRAGWQLGDQARLADYLDDVEDLDFGKLRVDLPSMTLAAGLAAVLLATLAVAPLALVPIALLLLALLFVARLTARAGVAAWDESRKLRRRGAQALGAALAATVPLRAEGAWAERSSAALGDFSLADERLLRLRRRQVRLDALAALLGPAAMLSVIGGAALAGRRGEDLLLPVFVAFTWLALSEGLQGASRLLLAELRRRAARHEIARWTEGELTTPDATAPATPATLAFAALQRQAPDGRPLGRPLALTLEAGRPTILVGASGAGKTSLLKQVGGWIGEDEALAGRASLSAERRRHFGLFCPHDAAILADTVRANLFAPGRPDAALWDALVAVELDGRIREAGGLDAWITQESLSLGEAQRLNLARAWLSPKPLVLLDEPTEHLDDAQAERILKRLLDHLADRIVVLSSHRFAELPHATTLRL